MDFSLSNNLNKYIFLFYLIVLLIICVLNDSF